MLGSIHDLPPISMPFEDEDIAYWEKQRQKLEAAANKQSPRIFAAPSYPKAFTSSAIRSRSS
jgi:hypothetical protein